MKIVRLTTLLDFGGQERKFISFAQDADLLHNDYYFAAIGYGGHAEKTLLSRGFNVTIFNQKPNISNLKNIWILYKWFKKLKPDLVHTAAAEANFHGTIAAKLAGVKVVIAEEIGFPKHSKKARFVFRQVYKLCHKVICVSKAVKIKLMEIKEIQNDKGEVIYNPVGIQTLTKRSIPTDFTIVCVGRLEKVKNQQALIRTFSKLEIPNARLILVGEGRERENLEKLIKDLNCQHKVEIVGFSAEPEKYLSQATLFVLPSLSEGFGIAVLEAMQQGLPCLCSNVGGIPEFVEEDKTGWLFNPNNENELFEKLSQICQMPEEKRSEIGANAKAYVANRFSEIDYVKNLENLYQKYYD
ncbi:glycosyltransferase [Flavobacterium franklandianum]|uniref:Glycosyltransferase n=1 Tax=Flavobacterium franklandianum TaxID=2594430 RepID=A0A553CK74_9FLAO|nr:glycosyltransferase [Flavobacterium franklandianum]TRX20895.1 glycosyltransferase [Flavobacterium franklandianum]TRX23163.1 glycosyltransferase [Flavobacterium franklandianum]